MASPESIAAGGTGNSGSLAADTMFYVETGSIDLTSATAAGYARFDNGDKVVFSSGLTVYWRNPGTEPVTLVYFSL